MALVRDYEYMRKSETAKRQHHHYLSPMHLAWLVYLLIVVYVAGQALGTLIFGTEMPNLFQDPNTYWLP